MAFKTRIDDIFFARFKFSIHDFIAYIGVRALSQSAVKKNCLD